MMRSRLALVLLLVACKPGESKLDRQAAATARPAAGDAGAPGDAPLADLASELEAVRAELNVPALAAAAWRDGARLDQAAVGLRRVDDPSSRVTPQDLWHLGSNTKAMTAMLIGVFVDRGTLRWTDTIGQLLPGVPVDAGYKNVTLDQLVRHEGGAPGEPPAAAWKQLWADGAAPGARATFVKAVLATPPAQPPGTFAYSNAGYMIASAMLEQKTGKPWDQLIRDELFARLDMKTCGFGAPGRKDVIDQPWGHDAGGTPIAPGPAADNPPGLGPAGTVHCSLDDYGKFLNVLATGTPAVVTPETLQHLTTARSHNGYAGGWMAIAQPRGTLLVHSGSNTMWYATAFVSPARRTAFVVVTNKGEPRLESKLEQLLKRFAPPS